MESAMWSRNHGAWAADSAVLIARGDIGPIEDVLGRIERVAG